MIPETRTGEPAGGEAISIPPVFSASLSGHPSSSHVRQWSPMRSAHPHRRQALSSGDNAQVEGRDVVGNVCGKSPDYFYSYSLKNQELVSSAEHKNG